MINMIQTDFTNKKSRDKLLSQKTEMNSGILGKQEREWKIRNRDTLREGVPALWTINRAQYLSPPNPASLPYLPPSAFKH